MNKQELIEIMESLVMKHSDEGEYPHIATYNAYVNSLGWIRKLDEPQKPIVPQFVAEYLNYCMGNEWTLAEALNSSECIFPEDNLEKASGWLEDSMNQKLFAQAWLFGYEIEKEPIYEVVFLDDGYDRYLLMKLDEKSYEIVPESENDGYHTQYFTEKQIKTINERYWAFAVPVEEVAEG